MRARSLQAGFTLVEVAIVTVISGVLLLAIVIFTASTNDAYKTVQEDTDANFSLRQALNRISDDLRQSSSAMISITSGYDHDSLDFQVPISQVESTINWGAADTTGWHVRVLVEDGWLIRRVTDAGGTPQRTDEVLARHVDDRFEGEKGFSVTQADGLYQITVRVTAHRGERIWRRTETTSVSTRN